MDSDKITIEYTEHRDADGLVHRKEVDPATTPKDSYIRTKQVEPLKPLASAVQIKGRSMFKAISELIEREAPLAPVSLDKQKLESLGVKICPLNLCSGSGWIHVTTEGESSTPPVSSNADVGVKRCACNPKASRLRNETEHRAAKAIFGDWDDR